MTGTHGHCPINFGKGQGTTKISLFPSRNTKSLLPPKTTDRWEIPRSRLMFSETIGKGAFGEVFKGAIKGTVLVSANAAGSLKRTAEKYVNLTVAVKVLPSEFQCSVEY